MVPTKITRSMAATAITSGLSLEAYLQLYRALTKDRGTVQSVTPIEECYYKMGDLKQLLCLHGIASSKFNRCEVLQALNGKELINPITVIHDSSTATQIFDVQQAGDVRSSKDCSTSNSSNPLLFSARDLIGLGWAEDGSDMVPLPLEQLQLGFESELEADAACAANLSVMTAQPAATAHKPVCLAAPAARAAAPTAQHAMLANTCQQPLAASSSRFAGSAGAALLRTHDAVPSSSAVHMVPTVLHNLEHAASAAAAAALSMHQHQQLKQQVIDPANAPSALHTASVEVKPLLAACIMTQQEQVAASGLASMVTSLPTGPADAVHGILGSLSKQQFSPNQRHKRHVAQLQQAGQKEQQQPQQATMKTAHTTPAVVHTPEAGVTSQAPVIAWLQQAGLQDGCSLSSHSHAHWLLQQLQRFVATGAVASREQLGPATAGGDAACGAGSVPSGTGSVVLGRGVGFVLMEEMQVAGPNNTVLTLPAGVFEGRVVKHLGSDCQPELCEKTCLGNHQFYRARVISPQLSDDQEQDPLAGALIAEHANFIGRAHAAISGRPVLLILDLHPRLRCHTFRSLLQLDASRLQDAWVLLKPPGQAKEDRTADEGKQVTCSAAQASSKRGRPGRSNQPLQNKRARV